jgi:hypothetical protein
LLLFIGDLARIKQTARRRRYVAMSSSSSSAANTPLGESSSEDTFSDLVAMELHPGHTVEFGVSRISSVRVQDMQQLGYFGNRVGRVPGAEEIPEPEGEIVVFEAFFTAGLRLPAQFGSCTFTPRTGKTSAEVVELVPCAHNKWGNWYDYWFYVAGGEVEDLPGLPAAVMLSHCYVVFPPFEVDEDDSDEGALRCAARVSSGHDLVEEFIGYGVWPLAHGWALGEVCPRQMPFLGEQLVRIPAFALDLHGRDPAAFVHEVEDGAVRIVGRYVPRTEALRSWNIRGSNICLNRVFELNRLPYDGYPGDDAAVAIDRRRKRPVAVTEEGPSQEAACGRTTRIILA